MQAVSIHVVDIANGRVAAGMSVEIWRAGPEPARLVTGTVGSNGVVGGIEERETLFEAGTYEVRLRIADYYRELATALSDPPFIEIGLFRFTLPDLSQHYHLPFKLTPWGLSCFRGA
jgi:5-hydroxyisourate hydrolase